MRVVFVTNPRSGRGIAEPVAARLEAAARAAGATVKRLAVGGDEALDPEKLRTADALVVVGGDGTVQRAAPVVASAGTPLYHAPTGNENLFARHFGMTRSPATLVQALHRGRVAWTDLATCAGGPMLLMLSVGPDAAIVRRVALARKHALGHLAYVWPTIRESLAPRFPPVSVTADGEPFVDGEKGLLVISNNPEYALGINPTPGASVADGHLDAVFLPCSTAIGALTWLARSRLRLRASRTVRAAEFTVRFTDGEPLFQVDGEWCAEDHARADAEGLTVRVEPGVLPILMP